MDRVFRASEDIDGALIEWARRLGRSADRELLQRDLLILTDIPNAPACGELSQW